MIKQRKYIFVIKRLLYMVLIIFEKFNKQTDTDHSMEIKPQNQYGIGIKNDYDAAN